MKKFYSMAKKDGIAEIRLYGEIVDKRPVNFWTDKPLDGDFIVKDEFLSDPESMTDCKKLIFHIDSFGGDTSVSLLIHNRLRELAKDHELECVVDGVAMSAGTHIMCACDKVKINPASVIMIHKCFVRTLDALNADTLRSLSASCDAWDSSQIEIYKRKTGLSEEEIGKMMSAETYMTGREAVEKGFADEITEGKQPKISASADRRVLFVSGRGFEMPFGMKVPDFIKVSAPRGDEINTKTSEATDNQTEGGKKIMAKNFAELSAENPELASAIEAEFRAGAEEEVRAERERIAGIDEVAALFDEETVREAKYGENRYTAEKMAYLAAKKAAQNGKSFIAALAQDTKDAGTASVTAAPGAEGEKSCTDPREEAKAKVREILGKDTK